MSQKLCALIVEDNEDDAMLLVRELRRNGYDLTFERVDTANDFENALDSRSWDIIIADYRMPNFTGLDALEIQKLRGLDIPFIILSGVIIEDMAIIAMRRGANDVIMKDNLPRLLPAIERELKEAKERKDLVLAEKKIVESEAKYRKLFEHSNDAIFIHNLNGNMLDINRSACEMMEYSHSQLLSMSISALYSEEALKSASESFNTVRDKGSARFESLFKKFDGSNINVEISSRVIDPEKGIVQEIVRDITERKRSQEIMIQTEKMMTVGGLAAGMAHEINNPLAGIIQNIQVMRDRISESHPKNRSVAEECGIPMEAIAAYMDKRGLYETIELIMESGRRIAKTVRNMLSFSRKGESQFDLHDLGDLLDQALEIAEKDYDMKKKYDFRQIKIVREYDPSVPQVLCEESKIQQVFLNLLKNGAQAMSDNKTETPCFLLRLTESTGMVQVEIEDNGPGMDETTRIRAFEPFFTTKGVGIGTGLGLSVSYFIITENHGGTIEVGSEPGKGATFIIRLPVKRQ